ncbi:VOC family protein [Streptomyces sp. NPDC127036]|uniref:VOC family protein n=1 Tax=Streptomyces sp. NPDC127036 TaxID=3347112 RepID=UPI0036671F9B
MKISSLVFRVADLEKAIDFYTQVLDLVVVLRDSNFALLKSADGSQVYLHGQNADRTSGHLGLHAASWTADSMSHLEEIESRLKARNAYRRTIKRDDYVVLEGRDPDGAIVLVSYPGPMESARRTIISSIATW